ncbi:MAG: ClpXP protease specificity-enhancing factor SspB [Holosporales bacterium]|jgi:hypothetical protein|nr:ClpXP protease specificity-enhancing factor SspB [Holosporales bacterium]
MGQKIDYAGLLKDASISVVRKILELAAADGFGKKQHLYVTFTLAHKNVVVSDTLREDAGEEMTIILQYEFWDLKVDEFGFTVGLAFEHADETLYIPFAALISVSDPSEDFSLEFVPDLARVVPTHASSPNAKPGSSTAKIIQLDAYRNRD